MSDLSTLQTSTLMLLFLTDECSVKVEVAAPLEANIVSEEEGDEDPGDDDISKPQHSEVGGVQAILKKILWCVK